MSVSFYSLYMILKSCIWTDGGYGAQVLKELQNEDNQ